MTDRSPLLRAFADRHGWLGVPIRPLAGDASFRRYFRLAENGRSAVLMDAPPDHERVGPFIAIARHLHALGFSAPRIFAADPDAGVVLLEDFGDDTFSRLLKGGTAEEPLYEMAVDVLVRLHRLPTTTARPEGLPAYDRHRLLQEALLLTDWYLPAVTGGPVPGPVHADCAAAWEEVLKDVLAGPKTLVLRDFHIDNLMRLVGREGIAACGLLDFQDAVAGHPAYDLMSLLEDARRDLPAGLKAAMLARYHAGIGHADRAEFDRAFTVLAAQRHAKVIGIFTRLHRRDGKAAYLVHIPRVWRLLEAALEAPALAPVRRWTDRYLPPELRRIPR